MFVKNFRFDKKQEMDFMYDVEELIIGQNFF